MEQKNLVKQYSDAVVQEWLLYRDGLMLVINKPAGLPVHPGSGGGDNLERYFDAFRFGLPRLPNLAHRLDRDTSGCLILGRHPKALRKLGQLFTNGKIRKTYWALVDGVPKDQSGTINIPLKKLNEKSGWRMQLANMGDEGALESITTYRVRGVADGRAWVEFSPKTGRTHQIRVHALALNCPLVGDKAYNPAWQEGGAPLHLHARKIIVPLYPNREAIAVEAPLPPHMLAAFKAWPDALVPVVSAPTGAGASEAFRENHS